MIDERDVTRNVLVSSGDGIGSIVLNRPDVLNAADGPMFARIEETLQRWHDDPAIEMVLITGAGRAFCAGGDIRTVREAVLAGDFARNDALYRHEYAVNAIIAEYPKPYVAIIDGYAMGGGLGLAAHGSHRVVSEKALLAMPETAIGFFPDVGMSYLFPRLPGGIGMYLGLTGTRVDAADALYCGLATHFVDSARLPELEARLRDRATSHDTVLADFTTSPPGASQLAEHRAEIDRCFIAASLDEVIANLEREQTTWSQETLTTLRRHSPSALAVTFALFTAGATMSLRACLEMDRRLGRTMLRAPDFAEGVRAVVIDKDRRPAWSPSRLEDVDQESIARLVALSP